ncbi:putative dual-specificity kinase [Helianthus debilis subsp. tardiflorus]
MVKLGQGEKKHYNHKVDAYSFAIVFVGAHTQQVTIRRHVKPTGFLCNRFQAYLFLWSSNSLKTCYYDNLKTS